MPFDNQAGWYAFLSLIPLIILHFIRPKLKERQIPSLMFFMKDKGSKRHANFLQKLSRNLLLLLHIIILSLLALQVMQPYSETSLLLGADHTVIVLDSSASMQTREGSATRFEQALAGAADAANGRVSIVLASSVPLVALKKGSASEARNVLAAMHPMDTPTNLGDAMLEAQHLIGNERGAVYVFSDFITTEGPDPLVAKRALVAASIPVEFVPVRGDADNVGIIDSDIDRVHTKILVKNFGNDEKKVTVDAVQNDHVAESLTQTIPAAAVKSYTFATLPGTSKLQLKDDDDFPVDDILYIATPKNLRTKVILITNQDASALRSVLKAIPSIDLTVFEPPVIPELQGDVVVLGNVETQKMLSGHYQQLRDFSEQGGTIIITAQDDAARYAIPLPVELGGMRTGRSVVHTLIENSATGDVDFGAVSLHFEAKAKKGAIVLATADDDSALLALSEQGSGKILYYGFLEDGSDFKSYVDYPIFWSKLLDFLTEREDLGLSNIKTGTLLPVHGQVRTPKGVVQSDTLFFDTVGIYESTTAIYAANLLDRDESAVTGDTTVIEENGGFVQENLEGIGKKRFDTLIILVALLFLAAELLYIKYRGDL